MNQLQLAESIARKAHTGQTRRDGTTPYIEHVEKVVSLLEYDDDKIVAWLHDVLEDTLETMESLLIKDVDDYYADNVLRLTKQKGEHYFNDYLVRIKGGVSCTRIKIADIVANLTDKPTPKQINKYVRALNILAEL